MNEPNDRSNPWISIPAAVYEAHMKSPGVLQQQFLGDVFRDVLDRRRPGAVAVPGCATGNGFEHIDPRVTRSVVGIDINAEYLAILVERYARRTPGFRAILCDIAACDLDPGSMDLVHCALFFEYVDPRIVLAKVSKWLRHEGVMSVVLQLGSAGQEKVAETEYKVILSRLEPIMRLVDPDDFSALAAGAGFRRETGEIRTLETGKKFAVAEYRLESGG
jgi:SAM-dependent methyltransferase